MAEERTQPERAELSVKQRAFVERFLANGFNASEAARHAGYSRRSAGSIASENLEKPEIQAEIQRRISEAAMSANEVLARLAQQARADMADFIQVDEEEVTLTWSLIQPPDAALEEDAETEAQQPSVAKVVIDLARQGRVKPTDIVLHTQTVRRSVARLDLLEAGRNGKLHLIKKYSIDKDGKVAIELHDSQAALIQLGKHHRLWIERQQIDASVQAGVKIYERSPDFDPDSA